VTDRTRTVIAWSLAAIITVGIAGNELWAAIHFARWLDVVSESGRPGLAGFLAVAVPCATWMYSLRILGHGKPAPLVIFGPRWLYVTEFVGAPLWVALVLAGDLIGVLAGKSDDLQVR
jgi:hypothetical protein